MMHDFYVSLFMFFFFPFKKKDFKVSILSTINVSLV